jgi:hypothetical protein
MRRIQSERLLPRVDLRVPVRAPQEPLPAARPVKDQSPTPRPKAEKTTEPKPTAPVKGEKTPVARPKAPAEPVQALQPAVELALSATTHALTEEEIRAMLAQGYSPIPKELWQWIPVGSHIRYTVAGQESRVDRFRPGAFVHKHITNGKSPGFLLGLTRGRTDLVMPLIHSEVDEIWKKYDEKIYLEMYIMTNSLLGKKVEIEGLRRDLAGAREELARTTARVGVIEDCLRGLVRGGTQ